MYMCMRTHNSHEQTHSAHAKKNQVNGKVLTHSNATLQSCFPRTSMPRARRGYINLLQHTATHAHTVTHCNTPQHTATHCSTLHHITVYCNALQRTATCCNSLQLTATHCNSLHLTATYVGAPQMSVGCQNFVCSLLHGVVRVNSLTLHA